MSSTDGRQQKWFPLESNPQLMNDYVAKLGFDTDLYRFCDVFSTEEWALSMVPQPVAAVVLLYPLTDKQESFRGRDKLAKDQMDKIWFTKQRIGNACGTIGLLHAVQNAPDGCRVYKEGSWLAKFSADTPVTLDPIAKAERLETDDTIASLHDEATSSETNSTDRGNIDDELITHFIAFVHRHGRLYELDGRKDAPVDHGPTTEMALLQDSIQVIRSFMERDPGEMRFTILALAPKQE